MKNNKITLALVSVLASSTAFAGNAVLNVEGEIQINGQTVIDSSGTFVGGSGASSPVVKSIDLNDYDASNGVYKYTETRMDFDYNTNTQVESVCMYTETISDNRFDSVANCDGDTETSSWVDNDDGTHTWTFDWGYGDSGTVVYRYELITEAVSVIPFGAKLVEVSNEILISSTADYHTAGEVYSYSSEFGYLGDINEIEIGNGISVRDCIITEYFDSFGEFMVRCKGLGYIDVYQAYDRTIEYTQIPNITSSRSMRSIPVSKNSMVDVYRKKVKQLRSQRKNSY